MSFGINKGEGRHAAGKEAIDRDHESSNGITDADRPHARPGMFREHNETTPCYMVSVAWAKIPNSDR